MILINALCALLFLVCSLQLHAADLRIAAATNLRYVLPELVSRFEGNTGQDVSVSYAASGTITTQIQHGAPFDVFLSANPQYIERLVNDDLTKGERIDFAQAQIALFTSKKTDVSLDAELQGLKLALSRGKLNKVAIANPKHAPYGLAAQKILERAGIWQLIQPHLLIAENASQAVQFALASQVDVAFVPYSHMIQPKISSKGRFVKLDVLLPQQAVLIRGGSDTAELFMGFIQTEQAKVILRAQGFVVEGKSQ